MDTEFHEGGRAHALEGDAGLWGALSDSVEFDVFMSAWLAILSRSVAGIRFSGVIVQSLAGEAAPAPALWPPDADPESSKKFSEVASAVTPIVASKLQPAVMPAPSGFETFAGVPVLVDGELFAVVVVRAVVDGMAGAQRLVRHLQWGAAWLEVFVRRKSGVSERTFADRAERLIDIVQAVVGEATALAASQALMSRLVDDLEFSWAAIGVPQKGSIAVDAVLHATRIDRKEPTLRALSMAMHEAVDQQAAISIPALTCESGRLAYEAAELSKINGNASIIILPVFRDEDLVLVLALIGPSSIEITEEKLHFADAVAATAGLVIDDKRNSEIGILRLASRRTLAVLGRFVSTRHLGWKTLAIGALAALAWSSLATGEMRLTARASIQGEVRRVLGAPFDGFVKSQFVVAGQIVTVGTVLAELEDSELELDLLRQISRRRQTQLERDRALGARDLAAANIATAQLAQSDAEIDLARQKLSRTKVVAPFDAVVVSGDLSQAIGRPVTRGETLFELAPLDRYQVTAVVAETDIRYVHEGSTGKILLQALPDRPLGIVITTVTPVARVSDGVNGFEVVGRIADNDARVRPGMQGIALVDAGRRRLIVIWTRSLIEWINLKAWSFVP